MPPPTAATPTGAPWVLGAIAFLGAIGIVGGLVARQRWRSSRNADLPRSDGLEGKDGRWGSSAMLRPALSATPPSIARPPAIPPIYAPDARAAPHPAAHAPQP